MPITRTRSTVAIASAAMVIALSTGCSLLPASHAPSHTASEGPSAGEPSPTPTTAPAPHKPHDGLSWNTTATMTAAVGGVDAAYWTQNRTSDDGTATYYDSVTVEGCTLAVGSVAASSLGDVVHAGDDRSSTVDAVAAMAGRPVKDVTDEWTADVVRYGNDPDQVGLVDVLEVTSSDEDGAYRVITRVFAGIDTFIGFHIECKDKDALDAAAGVRNSTLSITTQ